MIPEGLITSISKRLVPLPMVPWMEFPVVIEAARAVEGRSPGNNASDAATIIIRIAFISTSLFIHRILVSSRSSRRVRHGGVAGDTRTTRISARGQADGSRPLPIVGNPSTSRLS